MNSRFISSLIVVSCLLSCQNGTDSDSNNKNTINQVIEKPIEPEGENYSQEELDELVNSSLELETIIDTLKTLQLFDCGDLFEISNYQITIDSIRKYSSILPELSLELKQLLHAAHCFKKIKESENYRTYILLSESDVHYSKLAKLVSISKDNQTVHSLDLSYHYGNELGEQWISSTFKTDDSFIRESKIEHNYIHGIGEVDSVEVKEEFFRINKQGKFLIIK